jgi:hypothetical protein
MLRRSDDERRLAGAPHPMLLKGSHREARRTADEATRQPQQQDLFPARSNDEHYPRRARNSGAVGCMLWLDRGTIRSY